MSVNLCLSARCIVLGSCCFRCCCCCSYLIALLQENESENEENVGVVADDEIQGEMNNSNK